jgi:hypothetical protein
MICFLKKQTL